MSSKEKLNNDLHSKLQKAHRKYILLKFFIDQITSSLWIQKGLDVKLDLWPLSDIDRLDFNNPDFIHASLTSPNIMFDGKQIYFIDFGFWNWDEDKEIIFQELLKKETYNKWLDILRNFELL